MVFPLLARNFGEGWTTRSPPALFLFLIVQITSHTLIPLFRPVSAHSGSESWEDYGRVFLDQLHVSSFPDRFPYYAWANSTQALNCMNIKACIDPHSYLRLQWQFVFCFFVLILRYGGPFIIDSMLGDMKKMNSFKEWPQKSRLQEEEKRTQNKETQKSTRTHTLKETSICEK